MAILPIKFGITSLVAAPEVFGFVVIQSKASGSSIYTPAFAMFPGGALTFSHFRHAQDYPFYYATALCSGVENVIIVIGQSNGR